MVRQTMIFLFLLLAGRAQAGTTNDRIPGLTVDPENLSGTIRNAITDKPLSKVQITVYDMDQKRHSVLSDRKGHFGIRHLRPGTYKLVFEKEGFRKLVREGVQIKGDTMTLLDVTLEHGGLVMLPFPLHLFEL